MAFNSKTSLPGKLALELFEIAGSEIYHFAAAGTDQVMMMACRPPHEIGTLVVFTMDGADEIQVRQQLDGAVDSDTSDGWVFLPYTFVKCSRRHMVMALSDHFQHRPPLGCELVALPAQYACNLIGCKFHLNT